jgi:transposase
MKTYTVNQLRSEFPNEDVCLDFVFNQKYPKQKEEWYRVKGRKCYANSSGEQIHPLKGTIFEKSDTPLTSWFYAIYLMSQAKNGISAKELQGHLGVTYKTAWRIATSIRTLMTQDGKPLSGTVEIDETFIGGTRRMSSKFDNKGIVLGMVERNGRVRVKHVDDRSDYTLLKSIRKNVRKGSRIMTDELSAYKKIGKQGYKRHSVIHSKREYVRGNVHTNTIEGFWGQFKRSVHGTYHSVSRSYLQSYADEFAFRYNHRNASVFEAVMGRI